MSDFSNFAPYPGAHTNDNKAMPQPPSNSLGTILAYTLIVGISLYYTLGYLRIKVSALPKLLWNSLVHIMPSRLEFALDKFPTGQDQMPGGNGSNTSMKDLTAKAAMKRILGLDKGNILPSLPSARRLSEIGSVLKGSQAASPPGLGNWDNSCYQNSVIQGLASLPSLPRYLSGMARESSSSNSRSTNAALRDIIEKLNEPSNNGRHFWTPTELKSMSSWQQQDAQEYFSKVLDEVDKEAMRTWEMSSKDGGLLDFGRDSQSKGSESSQKTDGPTTARALLSRSQTTTRFAREPLPLRNPLEGLLAQRVGCTRCGYSGGLSLIPFNCLTVPLGSAYSYDLRQCLDDYTELELIEGVECAKCTLLRNQQQLERLLQADSTKTDSTSSGKPMVSEALRKSVETRLQAVTQALEDDDFSESTLSSKCMIPSKSRVTSTKSRQAVIARAPQSLVVHVNRSMFDEMTGVQRKNYADIKFQKTLDFAPWCLGPSNTPGSADNPDAVEEWALDPIQSMLRRNNELPPEHENHYELRAVITHYGRHENGHYICYRKHPFSASTSTTDDVKTPTEDNSIATERWWRLSDDDVTMVSEQTVLDQGGVFMLFYEHIEDTPRKNQSVLSKLDSVAETSFGETTTMVEEPIEVNGQDLPPGVDEARLAIGQQALADGADVPKPAPPSNHTPLRKSELVRSPSQNNLQAMDTSKSPFKVSESPQSRPSNINSERRPESPPTILSPSSPAGSTSATPRRWPSPQQQQQPSSPVAPLMRTAGRAHRHDSRDSSADNVISSGFAVIAAN
ncbi:MAG: hypothetical protein M1819_000305 [Sarea resinae]|nr:MAG: hypothetical protein M1819_000305 [Sarea resinae]